jgi:septum formation protein
MLEAAGVAFIVDPANLDERALRESEQADGKADDPAGIAAMLAAAKAQAVSHRRSDALVIGADQILALDCEVFEKPQDVAAARSHLMKLRGRTHRLHSAVALAQGGKVMWSHRETAALTMRPFSDAFIDQYFRRAGSVVCESVGAYQLEGLGIQLFERIDGDYFTILGLPLLPLLAELRRRGLVST